ncbi:MAG TPA: hypothetical protein VFC74_01915 [Oscillospiraceae bacterium]|nr:hypothetical protein [Oscillospiraceae bacterium]
MKLAENYREQFLAWAKDNLLLERESSTEELYAALLKDKPVLAKRINKAAPKTGAKAYIGRYLLRAFVNQGWLKYRDKKWFVQPLEDHCANCLTELHPDIYLVDTVGSYYCCEDCLLEREDGATDGYWMDYLPLFADFADLLPESSDHKQQKKEADPLTHLEVINIRKRLANVINCPDYDTIWLNGGDDGPLAAEMYRMLTMLAARLTKVTEVETAIAKLRAPQQVNYTIQLPEGLPNEKRLQVKVERFSKRHKQIRRQDLPLAWRTDDLSLLSRWEKQLKEISYTIVKSRKCPLCSIDADNFALAVDGYRYCEACYEYYELQSYQVEEEYDW